MATLCAYVPGASSDSRRNSGRLGSDSSSRVRSVVIPVTDSARGRRKKLNPAATRPLAAPHTPRSPISAMLQLPASPSASAAPR